MFPRLIKSLLLLMLFASLGFSQVQKVQSEDGVEIAYFVQGTGEPAIVFVHGWSCDKSYWMEQIRALSSKYKVVAIDLAGHGQSGLNRDNWTIEAYGEDVAAVVNHLNLDKVILVGHSMGGAVIIYAANLLKGKVIGLIGADTFQNLGETMPEEQVSQFLQPFKDNFVESTKAFVKSMFLPTADSSLVKRIANDMSSAPPDLAVSSMEDMFKINGIYELEKLDVPIISINSDMIPVQIENNKKLVKSFEVKMMNGVGHFIMLENPTEFNMLLDKAILELINTK